MVCSLILDPVVILLKGNVLFKCWCSPWIVLNPFHSPLEGDPRFHRKFSCLCLRDSFPVPFKGIFPSGIPIRMGLNVKITLHIVWCRSFSPWGSRCGVKHLTSAWWHLREERRPPSSCNPPPPHPPRQGKVQNTLFRKQNQNTWHPFKTVK